MFICLEDFMFIYLQQYFGVYSVFLKLLCTFILFIQAVTKLKSHLTLLRRHFHTLIAPVIYLKFDGCNLMYQNAFKLFYHMNFSLILSNPI